ncbi:MAG: hypothetical protein AAGC81_01310 [Pseudomonadota bacterium]
MIDVGGAWYRAFSNDSRYASTWMSSWREDYLKDREYHLRLLKGQIPEALRVMGEKDLREDIADRLLFNTLAQVFLTDRETEE